MKKLITLIAAAVIACAGAFALDLGDIQGTWKDNAWDASWQFRADGHIILSLTSSGETVYDFNDSNVSNFKLIPGADGVSISFYCKDTQRAYKFTKPLTLNTDLTMIVNPDWTAQDYNTTIKFALK